MESMSLSESCFSCQDFVDRGKLLNNELLFTKFMSTLKTLYERHHDVFDPYNVAVSKLISDLMATTEPYYDLQLPVF